MPVPTLPVAVGLVGPGLIGSALVSQINAQVCTSWMRDHDPQVHLLHLHLSL